MSRVRDCANSGKKKPTGTRFNLDKFQKGLRNSMKIMRHVVSNDFIGFLLQSVLNLPEVFIDN